MDVKNMLTPEEKIQFKKLRKELNWMTLEEIHMDERWLYWRVYHRKEFPMCLFDYQQT